MSKLIAANFDSVIGGVTPPPALQNLTSQGGAGGISSFLSNLIQLIYVAAILIFVFMVIFSAVQWVMSGGDKDKVAAARSRLTTAVIGIILLAIAFVIINALGNITGFVFFNGQTIFGDLQSGSNVPGYPGRP
ncbi:hypothetical protein M1563_01085 [Patescibacteria group bacterium]|nr:hypothetical protein [Patescibacteria group bacterium]MCL5410181.1 hypothetical protein [Patescibacteria group bacterium]